MAVMGPFDFRGGYSPGYDFNNVPPGHATEMKNCRFQNGVIVPRFDQVVVNASTLGTSKYVNGLTVWRDAPSSVTALVATCNAKIYTADATSYLPTSAALTFTDRTGATTVSNSSGVRYTFDSLNGILVVAGNSINSVAPLKLTAYNANAAALGGSPPNGDCVKVVNNFCFLARDLSNTANFSTVRWSAVSDPETWPAGSSLTFNKNDGEPIMALGSIGTDLYIFKQTSIGRLSTVTTITSGTVTLGPLTTVVKGIGCVGPLAIDNLPNGDIVFVGYDGHLYEFNGSTVVDLSKQPFPGNNFYDTVGNSPGMNSALLSSVAVSLKVWHGIGEVWVAYDGTLTAGKTENVIVYDYNNGICQGIVTDTKPKCFASIQTGTTVIFESPEILFHGNDNGTILAHGGGTRWVPTDESNSPVDFIIGTSILMGNEASDFVPRSLIYYTSQTASQLSNFTTSAAFDTYFNGGGSIASISGVSANKVVQAIPMKTDSSGTNVMPNIISFHWDGVGTAGSALNYILRFGRFFISDDMAR